MTEMAMAWMVRCGLMVADTILWRNRIVENPTVVVSSRQTDLVTVMVTDGERLAGNPTVVVGSRQTGPLKVMGADCEEISSWVIKMGGSQTVAARPY